MKIEDYEFGAFLKSFQDAVLAGYRLNLEDNAKYPQKFGSHMTVTLDEPVFDGEMISKVRIEPEPFSTDLINKVNIEPVIAQDISQAEVKLKVSKRKQ